MTAIVHRSLEESTLVVQGIMQADSGKPRLRKLIEWTFHFLVERFDYQKLMTSLALQVNQFPDLAQIVQEKYRSMVPMLAQELEQAGHPEPYRHARILGAVLDGMRLQYVVLGTAAPLEQMKQDLIEEYCT